MKNSDQGQVLIFQHSEGSPPGTTLDWLKQNNMNHEIHFWGKHSPDISHEKYAGLIVMGGPQNVDEEAVFPWLRDEKKSIEIFLKNETPVLGICLGGQLIAEVLGAPVRRHKHWEVGWQSIAIDPIISPLVDFSPPELKVMQWHGYHFETPLVAKRFASNSITEHQGFIYQDRVVGTQFHPETSEWWIDYLLNDRSEKFPTGLHVQSMEQIKAGKIHQKKLQNWYFQLLSKTFKNLA